MVPLALALAGASACLHALWNVLLKTSGDPLRVSGRAVASSILILTPIAVVAWLLEGRPNLPAQAWILVVASALVELAYFVFLSEAYRRGELSVIYPLARGTAPLLAVGAGIFLLGEHPSPLEFAGVACLLVGIWAVRRPATFGRGVAPALLTGVAIAGYSAIDRVGVRLAPVWLYAWVLWVLVAAFLSMWIWASSQAPIARGLSAAGFTSHRPEGGERGASWPRAALVGLLMGLAYLLILIAFRFAPLSVVAPLRESAIVLVTGWGVWRLRERQGAWLRMSGAVAVVAGAALLAASTA